MIDRYTGVLIENRYGTLNRQNQVQSNPQKEQLDIFAKYFEQNHVGALLQSNLNIILKKREQFVGTKTLCSALKTVNIGLKFQITRKMI